ncbi:DNA polymerase III subunit alpha, partial [Candidatus Marinamargulisbacteria bacterium SCGC AAA071-K20]
FGTMQSRAVVRDVGRVLDIELSDVDRMAKLIPSTPGSSLSVEEAIEEIPDLKKMYEGPAVFKQLLDFAMQLEGQARHTSTHAAGVVISRNPLTSVVPLVKNDGQIATQYPMSDIDTIGLLKMDILGLRNLTVMKDATTMIKDRHGVELDLDNLEYTDKKTYALLCTGDTPGIFQLESSGMRALIKDLKPAVFEDIIALLALYRPGPLGSGMVSDFVSNKSGKTQVKYALDELEPILKDTYGMIVYQEQVMQIASTIGGFSLGEADVLRRAMGKKKKSEMDRMRDLFMKGAKEKGFPEKKANDIFELCYKFAEYGFNKSHSAAYALISYQTAYLKANYTIEYMAALLSSVLSSSEKTSLYIQDCLSLGIDVLGPSVNQSMVDFSIDNTTDEETIRFGLGAIKNVGEGAILSIIENRKEAPYKGLWDFCTSVDLRQVNKRVLESLIKSGAMDCFGERSYLLAVYERMMERAQVAAKEQSNGQTGLFSEETTGVSMPMNDLETDDYIMLSAQEKLRMEKELIGLYISGHPLDGMREKLDKMEFSTDKLTINDHDKAISITGLLTQTRRITTRTKKEMLIGELEDLKGTVTVLVFQFRNFDEIAENFIEDAIVTVSGKVQVKNDEISINTSMVSILDSEHLKKQLIIDAGELDGPTLARVKEICAQYRGNLPLYFRVGDVTVEAHKKFWVKDDPLCISQLESLVGQGRVWKT